MRETAYAKINLALHVRRRRDDGYHELETLFAFVDSGDELEVVEAEAEADSLSIHGEFAAGLTADPGNLVLGALKRLPRPRGWAVSLTKRLPIAAGLGGGSADAGAVFRLVDRAFGLPDDWHERAAGLGADVPACVASSTMIGRGTGIELETGPADLANCPVLLVNPRLPLATGAVFRGWDGVDRGALSEGSAREMALQGRNDLEASAVALCPGIAMVLAALDETGPVLARMSGSGASCFAIYNDQRTLAEALKILTLRQPDWWTMAGRLR